VTDPSGITFARTIERTDRHMSITQADVEQTINAFLVRAKKDTENVTPDTPLYSGGVGLDSLETAELSAVLEDTFGTDPFSSGSMPQTVSEILQFYGFAPART
jgi:acyl carrier protein